MEIPLTPVSSTNLEAIGYDKATGTLRIRFTSGATYDYRNVTPDIHNSLMNSPSKGRYFGEYIKPFTERYPYQRVN